MTLGDTLKSLRLQAAMTQRQLANVLDIHFSYISKIEHNAFDVLPSDDLLKRMAIALGAEEDALLIAANKLDFDVLQQVARDCPIIARFLRQLSRGEISDEQIQRLLAMIGDTP